MFARLIGRTNYQSESDPEPKEDKPEDEVALTDTTNKEWNGTMGRKEGERPRKGSRGKGKKGNNTTWKVKENNNNNEENQAKYDQSPNVFAMDQSKPKEMETVEKKLASAWIVPFQPATAWPQSLSEALPANLRKACIARDVNCKGTDEKMIAAELNRQEIVNSRKGIASKHNNRVAHVSLVKKDSEEVGIRARELALSKKQADAASRREIILNWKQELSSYLSRVSPDASIVSIVSSSYSEDSLSEDSVQRVSQKRMENAVRARELILKEIRARAADQICYARNVAQEVQNAEEEYAELATEALKQRLERAQFRRNIVIDRKRLAAGRHSNYVKSVYLTNKYMERRTGQMIKHSMEAAAFRKEVKLEETKSNARQHNLSAQFRACCAYRLFDAKWLNKALRSTAAQTTAKMRRDINLEALMKRLHESEVHRADVFASHQLLQAHSSELLTQSNEKVRAATERRMIILEERVSSIKERENILRARKNATQAKRKKAALKDIRMRLEAASRRREVIIERKRQTNATRNWYVKIAATRHAEQLEEQAALKKEEMLAGIDAAEQRRQEMVRPIFAELNAIRGERCQQVLEAYQHAKERYFMEKRGVTSYRIACLLQSQFNRTMHRTAHENEVRNRKERMDAFKKQCISSTMFARVRTADIRRAIYQDSIKATAETTQQRAQAARTKLRLFENEAREDLEIRQRIAEARREEQLNMKKGAAIWFLGKVAMGRKRLDNIEDAMRAYYEETQSNASLRKAIMLTRIVQSNARRQQRHQSCRNALAMQSVRHQIAQDEREGGADARREEVLRSKVQTARSTSNRVSVARLEKRAEQVVDCAIRTAIMKTMTKNAEVRRQANIESVQQHAATQVSHAKAVAEAQRELNQVRAEAKLEQSKLRMLQTSKRRDDLMEQRKIGQSIESLQPYAGLQVVGHAVSITPHVA